MRRRRLYQNSEIRGSLSHGISQPGRCTGFDWRVPGENLQPRAPAFGARLSSTTGVRAPPAPRPSCEERIGMSFLRHGESIDPMKVYATGSKHLAHSQCSSASMSSSRLFLGRLLSSRACLCFADRERFSKTKPRRTMIFQRTAATPLTPCLSTRVHSIIELPSSFPTLSGTGWHWEQRQRFWPRPAY